MNPKLPPWPSIFTQFGAPRPSLNAPQVADFAKPARFYRSGKRLKALAALAVFYQ
jgi:hypothetical protein